MEDPRKEALLDEVPRLRRIPLLLTILFLPPPPPLPPLAPVHEHQVAPAVAVQVAVQNDLCEKTSFI